ncbi:DUF4876 domain-containing protein [Prevotella amnii]|uniref:DUF4876 domain-containing protein n=1 Tax=Prevotella amnii TaxID=419005 RepID=UPI00336AA423
MKKTILCALAIIALFANCTRNGDIIEGKNNAEAKSPDLIIKDIYYAGNYMTTPYGNKSEETDDKFISIYNPTDHDISLENTVLAVCLYDAAEPVAFTNPKDDYTQKGFGVSNMIGFPLDKDNKPYVVKKGETIIVAMKAVNHSEHNKKYLSDNGEDPSQYKGWDKFIDLSNANFEWGTDGNDKVPHMKFIYCKETYKEQELAIKTDKTKVGVWDEDDEKSVPFGFDKNFTIGLLRLQEPIEKIKADMTNATTNEKLLKEVENSGSKYGRFVNWTSDSHAKHQILMFLPNEWVVDAVNVRYKGATTTKTSYAPISRKLDKAWNGVYTKADDNLEVGAGKMLTRRYDGKKFSDIDDSSVDFEVKPVVVPNK